MAKIKLQQTRIVEQGDGSAVVEIFLADTESIDTMSAEPRAGSCGLRWDQVDLNGGRLLGTAMPP